MFPEVPDTALLTVRKWSWYLRFAGFSLSVKYQI
jgi:hypothetical protein